MAGSGPPPKHPSTRRRQNRSSTAATLTLVHNVTAPDLPAGREWHELTLEWWADVWASPMAPEYHESDKHGLFILAALVDDFWREPSREIAAEIRLQRTRFGLTPMDRRSLQWEIERGEEAEERTTQRRQRKSKPKARQKDPRALLAG